MSNTIFFSWQVDTEPRNGRNLIDVALEKAAARIGKDTEIEEAIRDVAIDRDTKGVAGSPPIVDTIFRKIDSAAVFVPDLTFIGKRPDGRPTPNPNVLIEYGWALKSLTYGRIVPVMNTASGEPTGDNMPFDMRHLRNPITYHCPAGLDGDARRSMRDQLSKDLETAIRTVLDSEEFRASLPNRSDPAKFISRQPADGYGRFKPIGEPVGVATSGGLHRALHDLFISNHPATWLRLMPTTDPGRTWTVDELERHAQTPYLHPLSAGWQGYDHFRTQEGFGIYTFFPEKPQDIRAIVVAFTNGEVWSIDTYWLDAYRNDQNVPTVPTSEDGSFRKALTAYASFLVKLGITPPFKWIAGMERLKGRLLYMPSRPGHMRMPGPHGKCVEDIITETGIYSPGQPPAMALRPFFEKLYNACGVRREDWQDT